PSLPARACAARPTSAGTTRTARATRRAATPRHEHPAPGNGGRNPRLPALQGDHPRKRQRLPRVPGPPALRRGVDPAREDQGRAAADRGHAVAARRRRRVRVHHGAVDPRRTRQGSEPPGDRRRRAAPRRGARVHPAGRDDRGGPGEGPPQALNYAAARAWRPFHQNPATSTASTAACTSRPCVVGCTPSSSKRGKSTRLAGTQPASCSAATPLPASTTARIAIRIALIAKNLPNGRRRLKPSIAQPIANSATTAVAAPAGTAGWWPRP